MDDKKTEKGIKGLESAAGFIQTTLSRKLSLRQFPKLQFVADSSIKDGFEMVHKLAEITASDAAVSAVIDKDVETE